MNFKILTALFLTVPFNPLAHSTEVNHRPMTQIPIGSILQIKQDIVTKNCNQPEIKIEGSDPTCYDEKEADSWLRLLDFGQQCRIHKSSGNASHISAGSCVVSDNPTHSESVASIYFTGCDIDSIICVRGYLDSSKEPISISDFKKDLSSKFALTVNDSVSPFNVNHADAGDFKGMDLRSADGEEPQPAKSAHGKGKKGN